MSSIIYTKTDEAPALATQSLFPIIQAFAQMVGIEMEMRDISLAGRILANFPEYLTEEQRVIDDLAYLGNVCLDSHANIVKLPNISASIPQVKSALCELQEKGYALPDFPDTPQTQEEKECRNRFAKILGSAVNPVLREGNADRRAPKAVKSYARTHPHRMGEWSATSQSRVASMFQGDFYGSEQSELMPKATRVHFNFIDTKGNSEVLREPLLLLDQEIIDSSVFHIRELKSFIKTAIEQIKEDDLLFSLHLKATMMKVSDPIIFGAVLEVFYHEVFEKYADLFSECGIVATNGLGDVYAKIKDHPCEAEVRAAFEEITQLRPSLAMVNSEKGITNLHVPSDIIIDASMPAMIRVGGKMWNRDGELEDTVAIIPDRCYAGIYAAVIDFCKKNGAFDPTSMGSVSNVGLMAQQAEEYGSHDKTFRIRAHGVVRITDDQGVVLMEQSVESGDIFRASQTKDAPIYNWVGLAVSRACIEKVPAIFWLDENRAHDALMIKKVTTYLKELDTNGCDIRIMNPVDACVFSMERLIEGKDTISVTGNVLRDYLTDLFPILEVGTSAKMLSIVPLMNGGGLFETGAGGTAPKHVQQFLTEGYLRWDSLGEFLALVPSLEQYAEKYADSSVKVLAEALDHATVEFLEKDKSPERKLGGIDNRGSHFYLALYWAEALATQTDDLGLAQKFSSFASELATQEECIVRELQNSQGTPVDIGGYYFPDLQKLEKAMRPSAIFNAALERLKSSC